ncbi:secreted RxLR effector protein 161-like [Panicum virgatum]|uniref:secreted RxLR effector protein 161-like n=1 Tax=Panicum virgatum TaxID=38727 RepID=UPI0019D5D4CA|nr:secreted RxLR effector protein 161-like [Panicum virgatum]
MEEKVKLSKDSTAPLVDATSYRSIVGAQRYLTHTRQDIGFVVGYVSRFMAEPREDHLVAVKHLLRYVAGTRDYGLVYPRRSRGELELIGFSDSDMAGDVDGRRSTTGVLFFLGACPISWQSMKQKVVALELTGEEARAPVLMVDNQSAITLAKNPVHHDRSKHIDTKFHFTRDCVDGGQIKLEHVETARQLGDILTKPLGRVRLTELRTKIGVEEIKQEQCN